jgi:hypothetical protein
MTPLLSFKDEALLRVQKYVFYMMSCINFVAEYMYRHAERRAVGDVQSSAACIRFGKKGHHNEGSASLLL